MKKNEQLSDNLFLNMAARMGISTDLFGKFVPEIHFQETNPDFTKPTIAYIHTGGTLMMVPSKKHENALSFEGAIDVKQVIEAADYLCRIREKYNIIGVFLANVDSKEISAELWTALAATIRTLYDQIDGVVVGHGTHTLEYTAAATAFALRNLAIPIVLTASQMPIIGFVGSDGLGNLTGAMEVAACGDIAEVVVYAHGTVFRGTRVTKKNDNRLDVFESRVTGPLGYYGAGNKVGAGSVELMPGVRRRTGKVKHELLFHPLFSDSVTIIKNNPSFNTDIIDQLIASQKDVGIIFETYGSGAVPNKYIPILHSHIERGFPIYLTSSCTESRVSSGMDRHDEDARMLYEAGVRIARDMTTSAATVKLMSIIANIQKDYLKDDPREYIRQITEQMIERNFAGEINFFDKVKEDF